MSKPTLSEAELEMAARELLSSNTANRYTRKAKSLARRFGVQKRVSEDSDRWESALGRAEDLWEEVLESRERTLAEIELAILLVVLSEGSNDEVRSLLKRVAINTRRTATWLGALSRRLIHNRPGSQDVVLPKSMEASRETIQSTRNEGQASSDEGRDDSEFSETSDQSLIIEPE